MGAFTDRMISEVNAIASQVTFDEERHIYRVGEPIYSGVSSILKPITSISLAGIPEVNLERARVRGTSVHGAIHEKEMFDFEQWPADISGYMDAYLSWREKFHFLKLVAIETPVFHKTLRYAGTPDHLWALENGEDSFLSVVDVKCTSDIELNVPVQIQGYTLAYQSHNLPMRSGWVLWLFPDGSHKFINSFDLIENGQKVVYQEWMALVHHHFYMQNKLRKEELHHWMIQPGKGLHAS
jgi:hypothetical protein